MIIYPSYSSLQANCDGYIIRTFVCGCKLEYNDYSMVNKRWKIIHNEEIKAGKSERVEKILDILLANRGIDTKKKKEQFLFPQITDINTKPRVLHGSLSSIIERIHKAISQKERIIIYGDYDVDGVSATGILWEALDTLGANVFPYIPHRVDEGYGMNKSALTELEKEGASLIITCDQGISAAEQITFAKQLGLDVIVTDHHVLSKVLPKDAFGIIHESEIAGAAVAWKLAASLGVTSGLDLASLGTIADLVPLTGENRIFVKFGLNELRNTSRVGLLALFKDAGLYPSEIGTYEVGHIIAPRLNAMGRLEHAMDSLRILLTRDPIRAEQLSAHLGSTNIERQNLTTQLFEEAQIKVKDITDSKILVVGGENWTQGVIGLVAGKLVDAYYRPSIVVSFYETFAKGSARSVNGFNIIEAIRSCEDILIDCGGHPMAAGFTMERIHFEKFSERLNKLAEEQLTEEHLVKQLKIDVVLEKEDLNWDLYHKISDMEPFGMGNYEPVFVTHKMEVTDMRLVGVEKKHVKFTLSGFDAIAFGMGGMVSDIEVGDLLDVAYRLEENEWNGNRNLQLKVSDFRKSTS